MSESAEPLMCGTCKHWKKQVNPANLADVKGECREGPPHLTMLPHPNGGVMNLSGYPTLQANFLACDRHEPVKVAIEC